jgi:hypothetical protein
LDYGIIFYNEDSVVEISVGERDPIVNDFYLYQNFPNPFNSSTVLSYQISVSGDVTIIVYDMLGQKVKSLLNEYKSAGTYKIDFTANDLPRGVKSISLSIPYWQTMSEM